METYTKEEFINKWKNWWMLQKNGAELTIAFEKELDSLLTISRLMFEGHISPSNIQDIRKKFFLECTEPSISDGLPKICLAPHDLFEWVIKNVFSISPVPSNRIGVVSLSNYKDLAIEFMTNRRHPYSDEVIHWMGVFASFLESKVGDYVSVSEEHRGEAEAFHHAVETIKQLL